jgi:hypothetical protein
MDSEPIVDVVIIAMYVLMALALGVTLWSAFRTVVNRQRRQSTRIGYGVCGGTLLLLAVTYLLGSTRPLLSDGEVFSDATWLRLADMFIYSSLTLIILCSVIVVIARFRR